jgi:hypothetical protein
MVHKVMRLLLGERPQAQRRRRLARWLRGRRRRSSQRDSRSRSLQRIDVMNGPVSGLRGACIVGHGLRTFIASSSIHRGGLTRGCRIRFFTSGAAGQDRTGRARGFLCGGAPAGSCHAGSAAAGSRGEDHAQRDPQGATSQEASESTVPKDTDQPSIPSAYVTPPTPG